jgi:copper oxidase (laccase) domain-containing protein
VQFESIFPEAGDLNRRMKLDLGEANRRQLVSAGIPEGQVEVSGLCTVCLEEEFYSYRREREKAGRMLSVIGPKEH